MIKDQEGKFMKILCSKCGNKQIIFGKSATKVKCIKCNKLLMKTTGGKVKVRALVKEVLQ